MFFWLAQTASSWTASLVTWLSQVSSSFITSNPPPYFNSPQFQSWLAKFTLVLSTQTQAYATSNPPPSTVQIASAPSPAPSPSLAPLPYEAPIWSDSLVDSIGVNTHCEFASIGWSDCNNALGATNAIATLGIRHVRDAISDYWVGLNASGGPHIANYPTNSGQPVTTFFNNLTGVKFDWIFGLTYGTTHTPLVSDILGVVPNSDSFEFGGNEPNQTPDTCAGSNPNGYSCWVSDSANLLAAYEPQVAAAGKTRIGASILPNNCSNAASAPPSVRVGPVVCPVNNTSDFIIAGNQSANFDYGNMHSYLVGYPGGAGLASYIGQEVPYAGLKPLWITENGYGTNQNNLSNLTIAKYEPRIFAEDFYEGVSRTFVFDLTDCTVAACGSFFANFGLVTSSESPNWQFAPKPQFEALRSFIQIAADPGSVPTLAPLSYRIIGGDASVHHILARRQDGSYQLFIWVEGPDPSPSQTVQLVFYSNIKNAVSSLFNPSTGQYANTALNATQVNNYTSFLVSVSDAMQVVRLSAGPVIVATPQPIATPFGGP